MAIISKGIYLAYKDGEDWKKVKDVYEIAELGGDRDAVEVTNLEDEAHKFDDGLLNYGDSLPFKCWYDED